MEEKEKMEIRKRENGRFLYAFNYTMKAKNLTQAQLAKKMGKNSSLISDYKSGKKKVTEDTMNELYIASGCKLNVNYMLGFSNYILLENVPPEELVEIERRRNNPDYDLLNEQSGDSAAEPSPAPFVPAWADSFFDIMTQQIKQNEALNRELHQSIERVEILEEKLIEIINKLK